MDGTLRLMKYLGLLSKAPEANSTEIYNKSIWIRAKSAGIFHSDLRLGENISKKDKLGFISDPYGKEAIKIKSTKEGCIIGINKAPVIHKGDALIHVAHD